MTSLSSDKLRQLLNDTFSPQKVITDKNVLFQTPVVENGDDYNTSLKIVGVPGKGYYNSVDIKYRRIDLAELGEDVEILKEGQLTIEEICIYLNNGLAAFLTPDDLEPVTIPNLTVGQSDYITLVAKADSYGWIGSVIIALYYGKPPLNIALGRNTLPTLLPPGDRTDYPSAWAMLYYQDFTAIRDALVINPTTGTYTDRLVVQALVSKLGIPGWIEDSPKDYSTSVVPGSNPDFDRVVVQDYIGSNEMYGPLYLHYNTIKFDGA